MGEYVVRFIIGGIAVSLFAVLGDVFRPKSFAGLFGAAPSIALSTLALAIYSHGALYASREGRTMMIGSVALCVYSIAVCQLLQRYRLHALTATIVSFLFWMAVALGGKILLLGA